jgi:hypothetical protein
MRAASDCADRPAQMEDLLKPDWSEHKVGEYQRSSSGLRLIMWCPVSSIAGGSLLKPILIAALQKEILQHDFSHFVDDPRWVEKGGRGVSSIPQAAAPDDGVFGAFGEGRGAGGGGADCGGGEGLKCSSRVT